MEIFMPLFRYSLTLGSETKTIELRKSNPQGWLWEAVRSAYPEIESRRPGEIMRLRLTKDATAKQTWHATFVDGPRHLHIQVVQIRS
jgi:hypothetical protein